MRTVVASPSQCIEQRDAALAGPVPDGLPVQRVSGSSNVIPDDETRHAINTYGVAASPRRSPCASMRRARCRRST
jgi:hypothetical protein